MEKQSSKMGRPYVYDPNKPRRQRGVQISDELWQALTEEAGVGKVAQYIEEQLRTVPAIATRIQNQ